MLNNTTQERGTEDSEKYSYGFTFFSLLRTPKKNCCFVLAEVHIGFQIMYTGTKVEMNYRREPRVDGIIQLTSIKNT